LTDGFLYYTEDEKYMKKFNSKDGIGLMQVKQAGIKTGIITGDAQSTIAKKRGEHLKLDIVRIGVKKKHEEVQAILNDLGLEWKNLAYFGDDLNDLEVIKSAGLSFCPKDAHKVVKQHVDYISDFNGGYACVRQACDILTDCEYYGDYSK
jgi:YrbI family 3-deoxy-D-manno-octulosonate 8-phosphate phosphatase